MFKCHYCHEVGHRIRDCEKKKKAEKQSEEKPDERASFCNELSKLKVSEEYGGFTPDISNVVFVHGSVDPWHAMGVLEDLSESAQARTCIRN